MNFRILIFVLTFAFGIVFSIPSIFQKDYAKKISLGLDLQGGIYMLLGVKSDVAIESKIKTIASSIRHFTNKNEYMIESFSMGKSDMKISMYDHNEALKVVEFLSENKKINTSINNKVITVDFSIKYQQEIKDHAIAQAVDVIRNRLDQFGLAEPNVAKQGRDKILIELPGIKTLEEEKKARALISKPAKLELMAIDEVRADRTNTLSDEEALQYGDKILQDEHNNNYLVKEIPILNGSKLTDASVGFDKNNQILINFKLDSEGSSIFGDFTQQNIGNRLAVVLDNKVYSAPYIRERIGGGSGQISGSFTPSEATNLAIALRSGSLLAPVYLLEKRSVGPSLGADSIKSSLLALLSGFVFILLFMIVYYGISGVVSVLAIVANILIVISIMSFFGATLTLPGMAGIVLTVGMAVDANVIINERIREFLKSAKSATFAIEQGYSNAVRAILDANITTLLIAVILYAYGTGTIKGFAITMSIGILASMLTAILCTHGVYQRFLHSINKNKKLWFGIDVQEKGSK